MYDTPAAAQGVSSVPVACRTGGGPGGYSVPVSYCTEGSQCTTHQRSHRRLQCTTWRRLPRRLLCTRELPQFRAVLPFTNRLWPCMPHPTSCRRHSTFLRAIHKLATSTHRVVCVVGCSSVPLACPWHRLFKCQLHNLLVRTALAE